MMQVWFLVLVLDYGSTAVTLPQANQAQCQINQKFRMQQDGSIKAYCIVGVLPKAGNP